MDIDARVTHLILNMVPEDRSVAPGSVLLAVWGNDAARKAEAKAAGFRHWNYNVAVVALDDTEADTRWLGNHATPRAFFQAEYDDAGVPRAWHIRNALR